MEKRTHIIAAVTNDLSTDQRMQRICTSLHNAGYKVTLVGRELKHSIGLKDLGFDQVRLKCKYNNGPLFYLEYNLKLKSYIHSQEVDILCAADLDTLWALTQAKKGRPIKLAFDAHEYFTEVPELQGKRLKKWIWQQVGLRSAKNVDLAYTVNDSLREILSDKYGLSFKTIRNVPVYKESIELEERTDKRLIYQGVLNKGRCIEDYILMMDKLPMEISLHLYGAGDLESNLKALANTTSSKDRIHFHGRVSPEELRIETQQAWLGLNLLEGDSLNYYYSLANKFFDYLHGGVPSINSPFPEYTNLSEKYGFALLSERAGLVDMILDLAQNIEKYTSLRKSCLDNLQKFTWQKEEENLLAMYKALKSPTSQT